MFAKLAPQYLFALAAALFVAVLALFYTLVIQPRYARISSLRDDLSARQLTETQYRSASAAVPNLRTTVARLEVERSEFLRALPPTTRFAQVVEQLRANVSAAGAEMGNLSFAPAATGGVTLPAGVRSVGINMNVSGTFPQLFQVLRSLETQNRFTTVSTLGLQLPTATSFNPSLEGTMGLTVYTYDPAQTGAAVPASASSAAAPATGGTR